MLNFENLDIIQFDGVGRYNIPEILPERRYPLEDFIPANFILSTSNLADKTAHFFVDDYQFARFWNTPSRYLENLKKLYAVCSPDFSTYTDMPTAMQIYNHYRKHWLAAYWQMHGMIVYPTISWSTPDSYDWCFDGEPVGGIVAVSSVGCLKGKESKQGFLSGYDEMVKRLNPSFVIFYGQVPEECDWNTIRVPPYYKKIEKAREEKHGR